MDVWENLKFMEWINEFHLLSGRRILGHELNNFMTPLAMQVSMLKQQLAAGDIEKAVQRIEKLDRAVIKLKAFSSELFTATPSANHENQIRSNNELKALLTQIRMLPGLHNTELEWDLCKFESSIALDARFIGLFFYAYLFEKRRSASSACCSISTTIADDHKYCITLRLTGSSVAESEKTYKRNPESTLNHLSKIVKAVAIGYSITSQKGVHNPWVMSISPMGNG